MNQDIHRRRDRLARARRMLHLAEQLVTAAVRDLDAIDAERAATRDRMAAEIDAAEQHLAAQPTMRDLITALERVHTTATERHEQSGTDYTLGYQAGASAALMRAYNVDADALVARTGGEVR